MPFPPQASCDMDQEPLHNDCLCLGILHEKSEAMVESGNITRNNVDK